MDKIFNIILIILISLNGVFFYNGYFQSPFTQAQFSFFVLSVGILGSYLLYKKNKWLTILSLIALLGFFRSYLLQRIYSIEMLFQEFIGGTFIFLLYYITRELKLKENSLKWFLIPAILNILLLLIQKFDGNVLNFLIVKPAVTGFLGNISLTSCFLAILAPIFLKYIPYSFVLLLIITILCESKVPFITLIVSSLIYWYYANRKLYRMVGFILCTIIAILILDIVYVGRVNNYFFTKSLVGKGWYQERLSMQVGSIDGLTKNPILGWGLGSMIPIMSKIKEEDSWYCGAAFNSFDYYAPNARNPTYFMNHPHNEYIYGWWNFGIFYLIGIFLLMKDISKKFNYEKNLLSFSILCGAFFMALGYFFSYPVWFIISMTLGIYDNSIKED